MNRPALLVLLVLIASARAAALRRQQLVVLLLLLAGSGGSADAGACVAGVFSACADVLRHGGGTAGRVGALERCDEAWKQRVFRWPEAKFRRYYRVKRKRFFQLCTALKTPELGLFRPGSRNGKVLDIEQVVGACLRRLATTGDFFAIAEDHGMAESITYPYVRTRERHA